MLKPARTTITRRQIADAAKSTLALAALTLVIGADLLKARFSHRYQPRHAAPTTGQRRIERRKSVLVAYANSGHTTAVDYLTGIGFPEAERYASAFGREVAKQYRETHGQDPYNGCLALVRGRIHRVFGYVAVEDLEAGAYCYKRTREYLAGQRTAALHALAA